VRSCSLGHHTLGAGDRSFLTAARAPKGRPRPVVRKAAAITRMLTPLIQMHVS
jgi:hypothetical protein